MCVGRGKRKGLGSWCWVARKKARLLQELAEDLESEEEEEEARGRWPAGKLEDGRPSAAGDVVSIW